MNCDIERKGSFLIVRLSGELDHHLAGEIKDKIDNEITRLPVSSLVFDFKNMIFMDSSGIGMLMGRYKIMSALGGQVIICSANKTVRRILEMSGVHTYINISNSLSESLVKAERK